MNKLQSEIEEVGRELLAGGESEGPGIFSKRFWHGQLLDWAMRNPEFKTRLFRFVDVLPVLDSSNEVFKHLREYLHAEGGKLPVGLNLGLGLGRFAPGMTAAAVRRNVEDLAHVFITGANPADALPKLKALRDQNITFTADLLGELVVSDSEADSYQNRCLELLDTLTTAAADWPSQPQLDEDYRGRLPRVNISVKISALAPNTDPIDPPLAIETLSRRLRPLLRRARELGAFVNFDMESRHFKDLTLALFRHLLDEPEFRDWHDAGFVIQAYLRDSERDLREMLAWAKARSGRLTVRLVKGAYWEYETILARQRGWPVPVFAQKAETDVQFEMLTTFLLENDQHIRAAFASHNVRSLAHAIVQARMLGVDPRSFEIQMLYGMAEPIKRALVGRGFRLRDYTPIGDWLPGMAYFVRRLLENTSNEGFMRTHFAEHAEADRLLRDPVSLVEPKPEKNQAGFANAPATDFILADNQERMRRALASVRRQFGRAIPLLIGKERVETAQWIEARNPAQPDEIVGRIACATGAEAERAFAIAREAWPAWRRTPFEIRAGVLDRTAELMEQRRFDLAALEVFEVGKPWREADADVAEAIDFCRFYASEMRRLGGRRPTQRVPGEENYQHYQPRGVGVVIAPWNFPLAILTGMTAASIVCGNAVLMKPAGPSSVIGFELATLLRQAGLPAGVLAYLPGEGREIGEFLVNHAGVDFIAFTGSKEVGLRIWEAAGRTVPGQRALKHGVCEMGGKNALIVDASADLDEAVPAILQSAFGYAGQKCSALSRLIVVDAVYQRLLPRLVEGAATLRIGLPEEPATQVGPVISAQAQARIRSYLELGRAEAKLAFEGQVPTHGWFVQPTVFIEVSPSARLAREEIFGPVLAVLRARDFTEAVSVANDSEFALTAGVFSRTPSHLEQASVELEVGNLYLNRGITGAMVERQPFGGFRMSGGGTKAGGADYLLQFMHPHVVSENTLRRGFAPE